MPLVQALIALGPLLAHACVLAVLARLVLSRWLLPRLMHPSGPFFTWLRLPGNLVHEGSHALAFLLAGYRIAEFKSCMGDPQRRGLVRAGAPWSPHANPWVAGLVAGPAPLLVGALAIRALAQALEMPPLLAGTLHLGWPPDGGALLGALGAVVDVGLDAPWGTARLLLFLLLTASIGAEMTPSPEDLEQVVPPLLAVIAALTAVSWLAQVAPAVAPLQQISYQGVGSVSAWLIQALTAAGFTLGAVVVLLTPWAVLKR